MTVCVAAICENRMVVGASDRLLTAGDIQFEPDQTKIYVLTTNIAIMVAGDAVLNDEIIKGVERDKYDGMTVLEAAESYRKHYQEAALVRVENSLLAPLGLDRHSFLTKQKDMEPGLVSQIASEILKFEPSQDGVSVIFAGVDQRGPHIYVVNGSDIGCYDAIGFAAIGSGYWHAQSQLMFAGHTSFRPTPETMLGVYWAKKRAQVAPHVGPQTDMFSIALGTNTVFRFPTFLIDELDNLYQSGTEQETQARLAAEGKFSALLKKASNQPAHDQGSFADGEAGDSPGRTSTDGEEAGGGIVAGEEEG